MFHILLQLYPRFVLDITDLFPNILTVLGLSSLQIWESAGTRVSYSDSLPESSRCYCNVSNKWNLVDSKIVLEEKKKNI